MVHFIKESIVSDCTDVFEADVSVCMDVCEYDFF